MGLGRFRGGRRHGADLGEVARRRGVTRPPMHCFSECIPGMRGVGRLLRGLRPHGVVVWGSLRGGLQVLPIISDLSELGRSLRSSCVGVVSRP